MRNSKPRRCSSTTNLSVILTYIYYWYVSLTLTVRETGNQWRFACVLSCDCYNTEQFLFQKYHSFWLSQWCNTTESKPTKALQAACKQRGKVRMTVNKSVCWCDLRANFRQVGGVFATPCEWTRFARWFVWRKRFWCLRVFCQVAANSALYQSKQVL